jgi:hypothetical protein
MTLLVPDEVAMQTHKITGLGDGTAAQDGAAFHQIGDAIAAIIPQAGTWITGGYWDADHLNIVSNLITTVPSRESGSVLTDAGNAALARITDPVVGGNVVQGVGGSYLTETDATRWNAFGGTHGQYIQFVQFTTAASPAGRLMALTNSSATQRAIEIYWSASQISFDRYDGTNFPAIYKNVAASTRYTLVCCLHSDGKMYLVDETGTSVGTSDSCTALTPDRFQINASVGGNTGNSLYRRWGAKLPTWSNPLAEAQALYRAVAAMT